MSMAKTVHNVIWVIRENVLKRDWEMFFIFNVSFFFFFFLKLIVYVLKESCVYFCLQEIFLL